MPECVNPNCKFCNHPAESVWDDPEIQAEVHRQLAERAASIAWKSEHTVPRFWQPSGESVMGLIEQAPDLLAPPISDDVRASHYHQEQAYKASRRWTLFSLATYLVCLAAALILNIVWDGLRRVLHLGQ